MERAFAGCKVFSQGKQLAESLTLSVLQRNTISYFLKPPESGTVKAFSISESQSLPVAPEDEGFFKTPLINPEVAEYINVVKGEAKGKHLLNPQARLSEGVMFKVDQGARVGLKFSAYLQWLLSSVKETLVSSLGEDHVLCEPQSPLMSTLEEAFVVSQVPVKQFARVATLATTERRRLFLDELKLKEFPLTKALSLPVDTSEGKLFGRQSLPGGRSLGVDSIISQYSERATEVKKSVNAFKVPGPPNQPQDKRKAEERKDAPPQKKNMGGKQSQKQQGAQGKGKPVGQPFQKKGSCDKDSKSE